ncbi:hypothetical protein N7E01_07210 [Neopusillimonas aromaticivorans]|nr:hypothetical protein [Neopusillimonas aromaticivorans]WJJ94686.1 hypothetical protein N7E01_07210 [Neopusillimonas aromaticivorans]
MNIFAGEVPDQEAGDAAGQQQGQPDQLGVTQHAVQGSPAQGNTQRLRGSQAIDPVHEIVKIQQPDDVKQAQHAARHAEVCRVAKDA